MTYSRQWKVLGVSGSLRRDSYNTELLRVAADLAPPDVSIDVADIAAIPLYNADIEGDTGFPEPVERFRAQIDSADGVLIATPEYNWSVTGALKNAIDWASRRPSPLDRKPAAILGTGGRSGTARAQRHLRDILAHNEVDVLTEPEVLLPKAGLLFESGTLRDEEARRKVRRLLDALLLKLRESVAA